MWYHRGLLNWRKAIKDSEVGTLREKEIRRHYGSVCVNMECFSKFRDSGFSTANYHQMLRPLRLGSRFGGYGSRTHWSKIDKNPPVTPPTSHHPSLFSEHEDYKGDHCWTFVLYSYIILFGIRPFEIISSSETITASGTYVGLEDEIILERTCSEEIFYKWVGQPCSSVT